MKFYIGASRSNTIFGALIRWYTGKPYNHIYSRFKDPFTLQDIVSESSHGEAHKILIDKWYARGNKIVDEYEIECSEEIFRAILIRINQILQASYSEKNIIGVLIYDLGKYLSSTLIKNIAIKLFSDGESATICSESATFTLTFFGIQFKRPRDFVRPDHVIKKLEEASRTEDYIKKVKL